MKAEVDPDTAWAAQLTGVMGMQSPAREAPPGTPQRILIFGVKPGAVKRLAAALGAAGVDHQVLAGTHAAMTQCIARFRASTAPREVMLITGNRDCSGIQLPEATTAIFAHRILDRGIAAQLVGRGQRTGRRYTLHVHSLCYRNIEG